MKEVKELKTRYTTTHTSVPTRPGCWNKLLVEIFDNGKKIGKYERNYHSFYNTFLPFEKNGKHYALYSKDYQTTSVMSLPDCKHIADTESYFCPVDFYIPGFEISVESKEYHEKSLINAKENKNEKDIEYHSKQLEISNNEIQQIGQRGLVSGCVWGDDSGGWKVMVLDLSNIENGKISLTTDLGYFQLPALSYSLEELVRWERPARLSIPLNMEYQFHDDPEKSGFLGYLVEELKFYSGDFYANIEIKRVKENEM